MDSSGFRQTVINFTNLTGEEAASIHELTRKYPYSQLIHFLQSRAAKDLHNPRETEFLHQSAVYSTDRSVLKWVMTTPRLERKLPAVDKPIPAPVKAAEPVKTIEQPIVKKEPLPVKNESIAVKPLPAEGKPVTQQEKKIIQVERFVPVPVNLTGDALRSDLIRELEKLKRLKHDFELSVEAFEKSGYGELEVKKKSKTLKEQSGDPLIEEIKVTRKKLKIDSPKQKEQNEIIDEFIKTQPIIPKAKGTVPTEDLSEDSGVFSDHVVSETLVNILLKQGKKDKAIEVLKKLIWKFPQKKAYFAAQIEDLKN